MLHKVPSSDGSDGADAFDAAHTGVIRAFTFGGSRIFHNGHSFIQIAFFFTYHGPRESATWRA